MPGLEVDEFAPRLSFFFAAHKISLRSRKVPGCPAGCGGGS